MDASPKSGRVARLRIAEETGSASAASSMTLFDMGGDVYRIEFWPDARWALIPPDGRPAASRSHTDDGWFSITPISRRPPA